LAGFAEGSLSTSATASVALHLEDCETCDLEVERWERLFAAFQRLPAPAVPAGLSDRILFSVARERARQSRVASWLGRAAAALSWGYAAGGAVFSALALVVAIVPAWREAAARGLGFASGEALRFGLGTLDATSGTLGLIRDGVGDVLNRTEWISVLGRAFAAAASQPEAQLVLAAGGSATLLLLLVLLAGRPGRRDRLEAPHAGFLVA
jgi:anti-sigma factor RsiW